MKGDIEYNEVNNFFKTNIVDQEATNSNSDAQSENVKEDEISLVEIPNVRKPVKPKSHLALEKKH